MYSDILTKLDLAKNEAIIYETLLKHGRSSVGSISVFSQIHRRNVYDSINRLIEKGYVFEIIQKKDNKYEAVNPQKLMEGIKEKENILKEIMPSLEKLYNTTPANEAIYIYKGVEGWKNYLNNVLEVGEDLYTISGKGAWADKRLKPFLDNFLKEANNKGIKFYTLYDEEGANIPQKVLDTSTNQHKFLPKGFPSSSSIDIFGNHVVIFSNIINGEIDDNATLTVIINKSVADSFRVWFNMIWSLV